MSSSNTPRRRRRGSTNELSTIYWRDIPAQVTATCDGVKGSWLLDDRFQVAIDRAATIAGLTNADDYVRQWRRVAQPCEPDPDATARARADAQALQLSYGPDRLQALVDNGGLEPNVGLEPNGELKSNDASTAPPPTDPS